MENNNITKYISQIVSVMVFFATLVSLSSQFTPRAYADLSTEQSILTVYNNNPTFTQNTTSLGEIGACINGTLSVTPINPGKSKSVFVPNTFVNPTIEIKTLINSSADGRAMDPCEYDSPETLFWSSSVTYDPSSDSRYFVNVSGDESSPQVDHGIATDLETTGLQDDVSVWSANGQALSIITMEDFEGELFQAVRGTINNNIYTRKSTDGFNWSPWVANGQTLGQVSMESVGGKLYQTVRGTDNNIWTRNTEDGNNWSPWTPDGQTFGTVTSQRYGVILVQSVRGTDNNIYTRANLGDTWGGWYPAGQTFYDIAMTDYNDHVYQAVVGTDNLIYVRRALGFPFDGTVWSPWQPVTDSGTSQWVISNSQSVSFAVINSQLYIATTNQNDHPIIIHLNDPSNSNQGTVTVDTQYRASQNTLSSLESYYPGGDDYVANVAVQTITGKDNGYIYIRKNYYDSPWTGWALDGITYEGITSSPFNNALIQSVVGTDGLIYTRTYGYGAG